jgi:Protein of unknown function (DUF664)
VYTRVIEEYARHSGHADLLRQRVDGTTGSWLDEGGWFTAAVAGFLDDRG